MALGETFFSWALSSSYILGVRGIDQCGLWGTGIRFWKARFNCPFGRCFFNLGKPMWIFIPGLDLGNSRNLGSLVLRYSLPMALVFLLEVATPLAKYKTETLTPPKNCHNQFVRLVWGFLQFNKTLRSLRPF